MKTLNYLHLDASQVEGIVSSLKLLLADYQVFYTNLRGLHWNIQGHAFFVLHAKFEELYNDAAQKADELAERILTLGGVPENRFSEYLRQARLAEAAGISTPREAVALVLESYAHLIGEERKLLAAASEAGDEATVALMSDYLREQEKTVWMLTASAQNECGK
ncbi:Dps family protein [Alistipes sp.]|uniref:Dps family protein n=1 Tax=Alistipes sp. TaxID=1872444 RepID=UPI003AF13077